MARQTDALLLFSGGLDSILAAKVLEAQGLKVKCVHFTTPFFGVRDNGARWRELYDLDIHVQSATLPFVSMLARGPEHGVGKALNPCVDCKILLLSLADSLASQYGAEFLATGEVLGQRPMSQRRDSLNMIRKKAALQLPLLRPLCARLFDPTPVESSGLVDRSRLLAISGRGRQDQLDLARKFNLRHIPTPAGGCRLTERENTRRYWVILKKFRANPDFSPTSLQELAKDFELAGIGRQFWRREGGNWLCVGRNSKDNANLLAAKRPGDAILKLSQLPGPLALARNGASWPRAILAEAAALMASHAPKAAHAGGPTRVRADNPATEFNVTPARLAEIWTLPDWEESREEIRRVREKGMAISSPNGA